MGKSSPTKIDFIEPVYALGVPKLPEGPDWLYEIKLDGYRCPPAEIPLACTCGHGGETP